MKKTVLLLSLLLLFSCGKETQKTTPVAGGHPARAETVELLEMNEKLSLSMARGILFGGGDAEDRRAFQTSLRLTRISLTKLLANPGDKKALETLFARYQGLASASYQRIDTAYFGAYLSKLRNVIFKLSEHQQTRLSELRWRLDGSNFENGLGNFLTFGEPKWESGSYNRTGFAKVKSSKGVSWLVSPPIDLGEVANPALRLKHIFNFNFYDPEEAYRHGVEILVSSDYDGGSPALAQWKKLNLSKKPFIPDFNSHWSPFIDLASVAGETVSIALRLNLPDTNGESRLLWQVESFEVWGAALDKKVMQSWPDNNVYLFQEDFSQGLGAFTALTSGSSPAPFRPASRDGDDYIEASGFKEKNDGVSLLVSPAISLGDKSVQARIKQKINFYPEDAKQQKYIQVLYGVDSGSLETIDWKELKFQKTPSGSDWNLVESEWLDIPETNKDIRLGLRYQSGGDIQKFPNWNVYNLEVREKE